ncbi:MAG: formylglycine-generating enzyme family protein [Prevotellaceae bacterium]|jgi:gliding motility-associated lipoprotein GldJ|nr:formylglycine-generating enzyme family protein [Prevotellaceae bacterium]
MKLYVKLTVFFLVLGLAAGLMPSCGSMPGGASSKGASSTTGWKYNDPSYGGFEVREYYDQPTGPGLVFIPGGTFTMGRVTEDLPFDWNNTPRRVSVDSYYIDATEVRNVDYREYVFWLQRIYSYPEVARKALPDTLAWRRPLAYNEPLVEYYFRLASFNDYPVVGVSWVQANDYCNWRTDRVNELALIRSGILEFNIDEQRDDNSFNTDAYLAGLYNGKVKKNLPDISGRNPEGRRVSYEDGILFPKYRLPTEAEWEYAAAAPIANSVTGLLTDRGVFPWKGNRVRRGDGKERGQLMANFQKGRGDLMGVAGSGDGSAPLPMPVNSFWPNDFGIYCMAGNVNEWVLDVYRALSFEDVEDFRPFRGSVFTSVAKDEEGRPIKDSLGRIKRDTIGYVGNRPNYMTGDNRNFRDGDMISAINSELDMSKREDKANSDKMYFQGVGTNHQGMTSLVNETSRVYKGGSFLDRAFWLSPGSRRFLDESQSKEDLGFRCAMDRLGASEFISKKK